MTDKALQAFMTHKVSLGGELAIAAGTYGGGALAEVGLDKTPILSYQRSRGFYAGVEAVAQAYLTRFDENERIYSMMGVTQRDIVSRRSLVSTHHIGPALILFRYLRRYSSPVMFVQQLKRNLSSLHCARPRRERLSADSASKTNTSRRSSPSKQTTGPTRSRAKPKNKQQLSVTPLKASALPRRLTPHQNRPRWRWRRRLPI